jgi:hypothetical protein
MSKPLRIKPGKYTFLSYTIERSLKGEWNATLDAKTAELYPMLQATIGPAHRLQDLLPEIRYQEVPTYNMLNRAAGEFPISWQNKGSCCDPATESYHCM